MGCFKMIFEVKFFKEITDNINSACDVISVLSRENTVIVNLGELCALEQSLKRFEKIIEKFGEDL